MDFIIGSWKTILEVTLLWAVYYTIYLLLKDTAAEQVLKGIIVISIVIMLTRGFDLVVINWLLTRLLAISVIAFVVIFQPEIRRGLARLGRFGIFSSEKEVLDSIASSAMTLSKRGLGALIAIERETGLGRFVESGVAIDAKITPELIDTIFMRNTPLHDGGLIISNQRALAAACLFPLTQNPNVSKTMGTRHRAALGLSEETDAVILVVSEETGEISIAVGGKMTKDIDHKEIFSMLEKACSPKPKKRSVFYHLTKALIKHKGAK